MAKRLPEGISLRHALLPDPVRWALPVCARYQAQAWSPRDRKRLTRTFPTLAAARGWRYDALVGLRHGTLRAAGSVTLRQTQMSGSPLLTRASSATARAIPTSPRRSAGTSSRSVPASCRHWAPPSSATSAAPTSSDSSTG
jgi:hypothetical protein